MDQRTLTEIADILNADSWNYTVFLQWYEVPLTRSKEASNIVKMALKTEATLGGIEEIQSASVWPEVKSALLYTGDKGAGPSEASVKSEKLGASIEALQIQVRELAGAATKCESFWLETGHPAYPVFWDFAFLFRTNASASILIGSSSD